MIARGEPWERAGERAAAVVRGGDRALAQALTQGTRQPIRFEPDPSSDLALTLGLRGAGEPAELTLDTLEATLDGRPVAAVNAVVVGRPPERVRRRDRGADLRVSAQGRVVYEGRALSVVVANGQFVHGLDLVPRGHPGDGRFEVQVYAVAPGQRAELRRRLRSGSHLPHPDIHQRSVSEVRVEAHGALAVEIDGEASGRARVVEVGVVPGHLRLAVGRTEPE